MRGEGKFPKVPEENYECICISKLLCWRGLGDEATASVLVAALKCITVLLGAVLLLVEPRLRLHTGHLAGLEMGVQGSPAVTVNFL